MRAIYSAANLLVIPSRQDNLPNTGVEAGAYGTPVVACNTGGLPDIVEHEHTGYLAAAFDTQDLANGIAWVLAKAKASRSRDRARARAVSLFSSDSVADQYHAVYEAALASEAKSVEGGISVLQWSQNEI